MRTISAHHTAVFADKDGKQKVVYHSTCIVEFDAESVTLNSGGYRTATTKKKMNQAIAQFQLGQIEVYQRNNEWFVCALGHGVLSFKDGMTVKRS